MGNVTWYITCSKCPHVAGYPTKKERDTAYRIHLDGHDCGEQADYIITCFDGSTMKLCAQHTLRVNMADKLVGNYPLIESTKALPRESNCQCGASMANNHDCGRG